MSTILVLLHTEDDGSLRRASLEAISVARSLNGAFGVGLVGAQVAAALEQLGGCGASRVLAVEGPAFGQPRYSTDTAAAVAICEARFLSPCRSACRVNRSKEALSCLSLAALMAS